MIQFRTELHKFVLEELKESDGDNKTQGDLAGESCMQIALAFDKGLVPHPLDRKKSVHIKGFFLFSLPFGEFPSIPAYDTRKLDKLLKNLAIEHYVLDHNANTELQKLSLYPSNQVFLLAPNLKPWNKKNEIFLKGTFLYWSMDNFLSHALFSTTPLLTKQHFADLARFLSNIMTGMYRNTDGIPSLDIPFLNNALRAWFTIYQDLKEHVAGYEKYFVYFLKELVNWIEFYKICAIYMGADWNPYEQPYLIPRTIGGRKVIIELIQLLTAAYIDDAIRNHLLFKIFTDSVELIHNLVYETFCLPRDSHTRKFSLNPLMKSMTEKGISFEEALDKQILIVNNEIIDLQKIAKALAEEYPGCEPLSKYIRNLLFFVDGSIHYFSSQKRYGECEFKIMKVVKYAGSKNRRYSH